MDREEFRSLISAVTARLADERLDSELGRRLNTELPPDSPVYNSIARACQAAIQAGWMCRHEKDGMRYGRVLSPGAATHGFSVDVVDMPAGAGPHHVHPNGEIDLVMPIDASAEFDGHGAGWKVYGPGSEHFPTVSGGRALVLYLLPEGAIRFTGKSREASA